ncbi:MAG: hypothetical protein R2834_17080 [Rhodothermales bacterium]
MKSHLFVTTALILSTLFAGCFIESNDPAGTEIRTAEFVFSMDDAVINGDVASAQYTVRGITPAVVDHGAVIAYFREQGTWTAMPFTIADESPDLPAVDYTITLGFGFDDGMVEVFYEASTPAAPLEAQPDRLIKVVVLDDLGYVHAANLDLNNYEAVKAHFGLQD